MAALTGTNGVLRITNTTDTFTPSGNAAPVFLPQNLVFTASVAGHVILQDADGVTLIELYAAAQASVVLDNHFFMGMRPWKCPIKCSTFTGGGAIRMAM